MAKTAADIIFIGIQPKSALGPGVCRRQGNRCLAITSALESRDPEMAGGRAAHCPLARPLTLDAAAKPDRQSLEKDLGHWKKEFDELYKLVRQLF